ncbi:imidazolonepropionase [Limnochorda pilosa]|uniref:Imidazolonepropionase n=1 Tax=Limnochorda pilosa TaxID=1555112 RepID=A0A0K2SG98_LIMPI|nr:imidazolonepropionase [Limnochorda pilosa]BAS26126.1 imidazolonepropionase [Limnochorda pilosa]
MADPKEPDLGTTGVTPRGAQPSGTGRPPLRQLYTEIAQLVTMAGHSERPVAGSAAGKIGLIEDAYMLVEGDRVARVGRMRDLKPTLLREATVHEVGRRVVVPGFVDPHTHACFTGWRAQEFRQRVLGATYREIMEAGGGILSTVEAVRAASQGELEAALSEFLGQMLAQGTTTVEVKSGYGLATSDELKQLRAIREVGRLQPVEVVPTFLGAHQVPPEFRNNRAGYVQLLVEEMLPAVARAGLAEACDVFCEEGVFSVEETRQILLRGRELGLKVKLHADELAGSGGAELAGELAALSADHLLQPSDAGLERLKEAGTVAVLLPGTALFLGSDRFAPARRMVEMGIPVALATDFNPGSSPLQSMPLVMSLACVRMGLSPEEALVAATINAAHALGRADRVGSLEPGKQADFVLVDAPGYLHLAYRFGAPLVEQVFKRGRSVWRRAPEQV